MNKLISIILCAAVMLSVLTAAPFTVSAENVQLADAGVSESGTTTFCNWSFSDGVMTVQGSGKTMANLQGDTGIRWKHLKSQIEKVIINGCGDVCTDAFSSCENLTDVTINRCLTKICSSAFSYCTSLKNVTITDCDVKVI